MTGVRASAAALVTAVATSWLSGCGLGAKQAEADRIEAAVRRLRSQPFAATVAVAVKVVKSDKPAAPGPPKLIDSGVPPLPAVIDPPHRAAAVGLKGEETSTASLLFFGSDVYERLPDKSSRTGGQLPSAAATNLLPLLASLSPLTPSTADGAPATGAPSPAQTEPSPFGTPTTAPPTTTTTVKPSALRRQPRIPRQWVAFDYDRLDDRDKTKTAGSFAINPDDILRLGAGVLTGSIERRPGGRYDANVSRDKAERRLTEDERKTLDKVFRANAIGGTVFKATFWLEPGGRLKRFSVRMRQSLTSVDRGDLIVTLDVASLGVPAAIQRPDPKATAVVRSLGELVSRVTAS